MKTIKGEDANFCPIKAALPQLKTINAISEFYNIQDIPKDKIKTMLVEDNTTNLVYVENLYEDILKAFEENRLLDESAQVKDISKYKNFDGVK